MRSDLPDVVAPDPQATGHQPVPWAATPLERQPAPGGTPVLSVVVPLFDEEAMIERFHARLAPVMQGLGVAWEAIYGAFLEREIVADGKAALARSAERYGAWVERMVEP